jgi:hypothetical protein
MSRLSIGPTECTFLLDEDVQTPVRFFPRGRVKTLAQAGLRNGVTISPAPGSLSLSGQPVGVRVATASTTNANTAVR